MSHFNLYSFLFGKKYGKVELATLNGSLGIVRDAVIIKGEVSRGFSLTSPTNSLILGVQMNCFEAIRKERYSGQVFCGSVDHAESTSTLAAAFGLNADAKCYQETDAELARAILVYILHRDLAYEAEIMSLARAEELASQFLQEFGNPPCHFYTNGEFEQLAGRGLFLRRFDSATGATIDTGVLVLGSKESACVWVADED